MDAIHSLWTKPFYASGGTAFHMEDFDIFTAVLSALKWRQYNGKIKLVTDTFGSEYIKNIGIADVWDGIDIALDGIRVDPRMFWAAGKLYALASQSAPCAMLDTDFIVWYGIEFTAIKEDIAVIHTEELYPDVYPPVESFRLRGRYALDSKFDHSVKPCNTAFLCIRDQKFLRYYTHTAIEFMENSQLCDDTLAYMVFAEQRLLPMCAKRMGKEIFVFSDLERLFRNGDRYFTHTWGFKKQMRENEALRYDFCRRCAERVKRDFPERADQIKRINGMEKYFI